MGPLVTVYRTLLFILVFVTALSSAQSSDINPPSDSLTLPTSTDTVETATFPDSSTTPTDTATDGSSTPTDSATDVSQSISSTDFPTSTTSTTSTTSGTLVPPPYTPKTSPSSNNNAGAIAGGVVGGLAGLGVIAGLAFLYLRRRSNYRGRLGRTGGSNPPSPRLKGPWLGGIGGGGVAKPPRAQRLGSVGGESPPRSGNGHGSDDAHELGASNLAGTVAATNTGRHRSSSSRTSFGEDARVDPRTSYDLSVFNSNSNVGVPRGTSRQSDPFASETSIGTGTPSSAAAATGSSDLTRGPSVTRLARKPAPKYDNSEPTSPVSPVSPRSSKPPVSGPPRTRTYSNSSSLRAQAAANAAVGRSSSRSSLENPHLGHKSSQGTLGGAFKFAGEKEGPVHYLIPDPPSAALE